MKLGGSVLTDKAAYRTPRPDALRRLARELAEVPGLVVVHGAGSFGHVLAKEHRLAEGKGDALAAARVHADVRDLQGLVVAALQDAGAPALAVSTSDVARLDAGRLLAFTAGAVADARAAGFVPVLPGDVVLDASRRWGILSGDVLMIELARTLRPERAVFATDVDGIFDRWPDGKLLSRIGPHEEPFADASGAARGADVTGGMAGKLARAREVARTSAVPVWIVNGLQPGRVRDALMGRETLGTLISG